MNWVQDIGRKWLYNPQKTQKISRRVAAVNFLDRISSLQLRERDGGFVLEQLGSDEDTGTGIW
ncbi:hypothetical protein IFR05_003977 [Cadophora sp. M221]|nr:hypothetical protein IFR05_003977 [Cadophora sp. M221]